MKRNLFIVIVAAVMWACSQTDEPQMPTQSIKDEQTALTGTRTPEEAKACAIEAFTSFYGMSRALPIVKDVNVYGTDGLGRSASGDTTFYVVNLEDNGGYAVIAADRQVQPVLAVTEAGNIEDIDSIENPGARMFFNLIRSSVLSLPENPRSGNYGDLTQIKQFKTEDNVEVYEVKPRVEHSWGQSYPEGNYCPNKRSGCTNTATVLALSYFEQPPIMIRRSNFTHEPESFSINWGLIKTHKYSGNYNDSCEILPNNTIPAHDALADLCYEIGLWNESNYTYINGNPATGASLSKSRKNLKQFCPMLNIGTMNSGMPKASQYLGNGIIIASAHEKAIAKSGHAFIIDGYRRTVTTTNFYERPNESSSWTLTDTKVYVMNYNHINWGWNGADNGYYEIGVFNTEKRLKEDTDSGNVINKHNYDTDFEFFCIGK